jgi:hypothetical protein
MIRRVEGLCRKKCGKGVECADVIDNLFRPTNLVQYRMALALAQSIYDGTFFRLYNYYCHPNHLPKRIFLLAQHLILVGKSDPSSCPCRGSSLLHPSGRMADGGSAIEYGTILHQ